MTASVIRGGNPNLAPTRGLEPNSGATTPPASPGGQRAALAPALAGRVSQGDTTQRPRAQLPTRKTPGQVYSVTKAGPGADLNGKVEMDDGAVWCGAFAAMAALSPDNKKRSDFLKGFNTKEGIAAEVRKHGSLTKLMDKYDAMSRDLAPHQKHFVANDKLGGILHQFAKKLDEMSIEKKSETRERLLVTSNGHAMEIEVQCKIEDDKDSPNYGKSYFSVGLTGGPMVNHYRRVVVSNPEDLQKLTLDDFMNGGESHPDFVADRDTHVAIVNLNSEINLKLSPVHFAESENPDNDLLHAVTAATHNNTPEVFELMAKNTSDDVTDNSGKLDRIELLRGENAVGRFAMHCLMEHDSSEPSIMAYANLLNKNKNNMFEGSAVRLLIGSHVSPETQQPCDSLSFATAANQSVAIGALHKALVAANPSEEGRALICQSANSALMQCVENNGDTKTYNALFKILKEFSDSPESLATHLYGFSDTGANSLGHLANSGNLVLLEEYINAAKSLRMAAPETQDPDDDNSFENNQYLLMDVLGGGNEEDGIQSVIQIALNSGQPDDINLKTIKLVCDSFSSCGLTPENAIKYLNFSIEDAMMSGAKQDVIDTLKDALKDQQEKALSHGLSQATL
jgi:hypothetical protein